MDGAEAARAAGVVVGALAADLLCPPPVPARGHPAGRLVVPPLHAELPGRRGSAGRARARGVLRDGPALGAEVRAGHRPAPSARSAEAQPALAPRRDGGAHRRAASVSLAGGGDEVTSTEVVEIR